METTDGTDMQVGFAMALGALGLLGAAVMYLAGVDGNQVTSGWAFAVAMLAASLAIAAVHVYGDQ